MIPNSPLTGGSDVARERSIESSTIIDGYSRSLNIDVRRFFAGVPTVDVYRCNATGYRFYHPFGIEGDGAFYGELQRQYDWYYMDWKYEHEVAMSLVRDRAKVLEVGCGQGSFVGKLAGNGVDSTGLELNESAVMAGARRGNRVLRETIERHADENPGTYDALCCFQTLEHVTDVAGFLGACVRALKPGGLLVLSVPNNSSFVGLSDYDWLNMPPHHMGLWDEGALASLENHFPLTLQRIHTEPLQPYHELGFYGVLRQVATKRYPVRGRVGFTLLKPVMLHAIHRLAASIKGHSVIATFESSDHASA